MPFTVMKNGRRVPGCAALAFFCAMLIMLPVCAQQTVEVIIQNYRFQPAQLRIRAGDTVKWTNQEKRTSHSVVFSDAQGGESERLFPEESWQRRFDAPGRYPYACGPHPEMKGEVEVIP